MGAEKEDYAWRAESLQHKIDLERLAIVLQKVNGQIKNSSGYLGAISDRSKELFSISLLSGNIRWPSLIRILISVLKIKCFTVKTILMNLNVSGRLSLSFIKS